MRMDVRLSRRLVGRACSRFSSRTKIARLFRRWFWAAHSHSSTGSANRYIQPKTALAPRSHHPPFVTEGSLTSAREFSIFTHRKALTPVHASNHRIGVPRHDAEGYTSILAGIAKQKTRVVECDGPGAANESIRRMETTGKLGPHGNGKERAVGRLRTPGDKEGDSDETSSARWIGGRASRHRGLRTRRKRGEGYEGRFLSRTPAHHRHHNAQTIIKFFVLALLAATAQAAVLGKFSPPTVLR